MKRIWAVIALAALTLSGGARAAGQTPAQGTDPGITPNGVIGEVVAVDLNAKQMFVKTDAGSVVVVTLADNVVYKRLPPGETTLTKAADITLADVGAGDRVFARGRTSEDRKTVAPRMLIVMTKADISKKQEAERAEWRQRGVVGVVSALNPSTKEITLQTRGAAGPQPVTIAAGGTGVKFRRYAPDSVKFADAKPSTFDELKVGDQLRAKGDKSADGTRFTPEEVVSGAFRTAVGTITAVDPAKNEITITQLQGNTPLTVVLRSDSTLKRIPEDIATRMMSGGPGGAGGGQARPGGAAAPQGQGQGPQGQGGGQGQRPAGGGPPRPAVGPDFLQQMIETLPSATVAEMKPGQMIVVSSTVGADPTRVTAIQLVAGIEPLVAMMSRRPGGPGGAGATGGLGGAAGGGGINFGFGIGQP